MTDEQDRVKEYWDKNCWETMPLKHWGSNPLVKKYINYRITGDMELLWVDALLRTYVQNPLKRGLCLACGTGTAELHAVTINLCEEMDAVDLSPRSIGIAAKKAEEFGLGKRIHYRVCDLNEAVFPEACYDLIFTASGMHHIQELDHLVGQIQRSLTPQGILAVSEYVGPNRLQYTDLQLDYANQVLSALPDKVKTGTPVTRCSLDEIMNADPSEAVCSEAIVPAIRAAFEILEERFFGGTLLQPLFDSGAIKPELLLPPEGHPDEETSHFCDLLLPIMTLERMLNESGILPDDHVVMLAKRKPDYHA